MIALLQEPFFAIAASALLGLFVGSFLNVVIHRLPRMMEREWHAQAAELRGEHAPELPRYNLATPSSTCPHCGHRITALENIPLLSYIVLRGRCAHCAAPIAPRYPAVEALSALVAGYAALHFGFSLALLGALLFLWAVIALAAIDLDTQFLPDQITLPLLWLGLLINLDGIYASLPDAVIGAVAGYLSLWSVYWLFRLTTGKEGMGYGDFKLLAAIGAWLGWQALPLVILLSSLVGAVVGISLIVLRQHERSTPIPFGPYLAAAGAIALFWGNDIVDAWLGSF
ncbi:MAG: A24 family peptidase [Pseudazoarcus pumilus]|nr:A24 family peptidase [Pseudazoarcus pumilus]